MPNFGATSISGLENDSKYRQAVSAANYLVNDATLNSDLAWDAAKDEISATSTLAVNKDKQTYLEILLRLL